MRRADAEVEGRLIELVDRGAPGAMAWRAEGDLARAAGIVDQGEGTGLAELADMKRAARARDRQGGEIDDEFGLARIVLKLADRPPGADAPAIGRLGEVATHDLARIFGKRHAVHGCRLQATGCTTPSMIMLRKPTP
jgi:hypothetical protein